MIRLPLPAASATAVAQQKDQVPEIKIHMGKVQVTTTLDSDDGIPTEQFKVQRVVSYANRRRGPN